MENNLVKVNVIYNNILKKVPFDENIDDFISRIRSFFNLFNKNIKLFAVLKQNNNANFEVEIFNQKNLDDFYSTNEFNHFVIKEINDNNNSQKLDFEKFNKQILQIFNTNFNNYKKEVNEKFEQINIKLSEINEKLDKLNDNIYNNNNI